MNYPDTFGNGAFMRANVVRFFRQFEFRFTNAELLFLRHAPDSFVQMGGANFGGNHALEQANVSPIPTFELTLRTGRTTDEFEFLEPVVVELKLANQSDQPQLIPEDALDQGAELALIVRKRYGQPMLFAPFVHSYRKPKLIVLQPGDSMYASRFVSSGTYGWMIDEPGWYEVRACLQLENEDILSNVLTIRIAPPRNWDEEYVAQDFFSDNVAMALTFDGSRTLEHANAVLQEAVARFPERRVAIHANVALQMPDVGHYKRFRQTGGRYAIEESSPTEAACADLSQTLAGSDQQALTAAEALGNIDFCHYMGRLAAAAKDCDQIERAVEILDCLAGTCRKRRVLKTVQRRIRDQLKRLKAEEEDEDKD
jgi:hypothetical protein